MSEDEIAFQATIEGGSEFFKKIEEDEITPLEEILKNHSVFSKGGTFAVRYGAPYKGNSENAIYQIYGEGHEYGEFKYIKGKFVELENPEVLPNL